MQLRIHSSVEALVDPTGTTKKTFDVYVWIKYDFDFLYVITPSWQRRNTEDDIACVYAYVYITSDSIILVYSWIDYIYYAS